MYAVCSICHTVCNHWVSLRIMKDSYCLRISSRHSTTRSSSASSSLPLPLLLLFHLPPLSSQRHLVLHVQILPTSGLLLAFLSASSPPSLPHALRTSGWVSCYSSLAVRSRQARNANVQFVLAVLLHYVARESSEKVMHPGSRGVTWWSIARHCSDVNDGRH